jgi:membrane peptidoglycan carboxypeptidase
MSSHGDDFKVTAIQLATLVSAIANGGKLLKPYVVNRGEQTSGSRSIVRRQVPFELDTWRNILPGMIGSVSYGSGRRAYDPQAMVAGKTGTCIEDGSWVGLFTSFAPLHDPQLAVVVITRGTDARNHFPAAVAGQIYRGLSGNFTRTTNTQVASSIEFSNRPIRPDPGTSVDDDEAELAASDETLDRQTAAGPSSPAVSPEVYPAIRPRQANPQVRTVLKAIPQRTINYIKSQEILREGPSKSSRRDIDDKQ